MKLKTTLLLLAIIVSACAPSVTPTVPAYPPMFVTPTLIPTATPTPLPTAIPPTPQPVGEQPIVVLKEGETVTLQNVTTNLQVTIWFSNVSTDIFANFTDHEANIASSLNPEWVKVDLGTIFRNSLTDLHPWYAGIELDAALNELRVYVNSDWEKVEN